VLQIEAVLLSLALVLGLELSLRTHLKSLALALKVESLALALKPESLALALRVKSLLTSLDRGRKPVQDDWSVNSKTSSAERLGICSW